VQMLLRGKTHFWGNHFFLHSGYRDTLLYHRRLATDLTLYNNSVPLLLFKELAAEWHPYPYCLLPFVLTRKPVYNWLSIREAKEHGSSDPPEDHLPLCKIHF
jgi:hypothetical protein